MHPAQLCTIDRPPAADSPAGRGGDRLAHRRHQPSPGASAGSDIIACAVYSLISLCRGTRGPQATHPEDHLVRALANQIEAEPVRPSGRPEGLEFAPDASPRTSSPLDARVKAPWWLRA